MGCLWSVALEFKILKMLFSFKIFKKKRIRGGRFHITTQLLSVRPDDGVRYNDPIPAASAVIIDY
jgi:hypothetical protein